MKKFILPIICLFFFAAFIIKQPGNKTFEKLYAFEGMWIMKTKKGTIGEQWYKTSGGFLLNRGFYIKGNDTITTERISLTNTKEGIFYTSTVEDQNNKEAIPFKLTADSNNIFVFENPQHDFPKRIVYKIVSTDSLYAYIDGGPKTPGKRKEFFYSKAK